LILKQIKINGQDCNLRQIQKPFCTLEKKYQHIYHHFTQRKNSALFKIFKAWHGVIFACWIMIFCDLLFLHLWDKKIYQETRFMCFLALMWCVNVKKSILWVQVFLNRCQLISNWHFKNQLFPLICDAPHPFIFLLKRTYRSEIEYIGVNEDAVYNETIRHCLSWYISKIFFHENIKLWFFCEMEQTAA
jgi:hypothetical protein